MSLLSVKKEIIPFRTFAELDANNEYKLRLQGGTVFYDVLYRNNFNKNNPMSYLKAKVNRDTKRDLSIISSDIEHHENLLVTEKYAMFTFTDHFHSLAARSCRVAMLKERGERITDGFYLQKNSAYMDDFNHVLSNIHEGHLDKNLRKIFLKKPKQCLTNLHNVSLENIHGVFYLLFGGLSVTFITLIGENIVASFNGFQERRKKLYRTAKDDKVVFLSTTIPLSDPLPLPLKTKNFEYYHGIVNDGGDHSDDHFDYQGTAKDDKLVFLSTTKSLFDHLPLPLKQETGSICTTDAANRNNMVSQ